MKTQLAAATAAIALLAGAPAIAADLNVDPVLSTSASFENTTSTPLRPLQSRPGAPSSGERSDDPGEGMPPHSPGLAPTAYGLPPSSAPVYYIQPTYYVPPPQPVYYTQPVYYNQPATTVVTTAPAYTVPTYVVPATTGSIVGSEVTDMYGMRVGQVTDVHALADGRAIAIVGLGPWAGQVDRTVALPLEHMRHTTAGRLAYAATADQIRAVPSYR